MTEPRDVQPSPPAGDVEYHDLVHRQAPRPDAAAARATLEADAQRRAQACAAEYDAFVAEIQARHNCVIVCQPQFSPDGRVTARAVIAPQQ